MEKICVICKGPITADPNGWDGGHNAEPVAIGRCCGNCNDRVVTVTRLKNVGISERDAKVWVTTMRYNGHIGM
jgi:hypothetical protein